MALDLEGLGRQEGCRRSGQHPQHRLASIGVSVEMFLWEGKKTLLPWQPHIFLTKLSPSWENNLRGARDR